MPSTNHHSFRLLDYAGTLSQLDVVIGVHPARFVICAASNRNIDRPRQFFKLTLGVKPLWDGRRSIAVREASSEERRMWEASKALAIAKGDLEQGEEDWIAYLVPVRDPTAADNAS